MADVEKRIREEMKKLEEDHDTYEGLSTDDIKKAKRELKKNLK